MVIQAYFNLRTLVVVITLQDVNFLVGELNSVVKPNQWTSSKQILC